MTEQLLPGKFELLDGRPLTDAERELLIVLSEECSELAIECNRVAVKISKMLRFGVEQTNPETNVKNDIEFCRELGHLRCMMRLAETRFPFYDADVVDLGDQEKRVKLARFLQHAEVPSG